jgi:ABC-type sugar transport system permease subunit
VGFWNYSRVIGGLLSSLTGGFVRLPDADARTAASFWHAANFTIGSLIGQLSLGLALALIVHHARRGVGFMRLVFFMPVVLPGVAINVLFGNVLYQTLWGLLSQTFTTLHVPLFIQNFFGGPKWLLDPNTAMRSIITMGVWQWAGYYMVLFLAGLQSIPETYYEAAKVDGTNALQRFRHITLPLLRPTIYPCLELATIAAATRPRKFTLV